MGSGLAIGLQLRELIGDMPYDGQKGITFAMQSLAGFLYKQFTINSL
jgi:hypothetical protein